MAQQYTNLKTCIVDSTPYVKTGFAAANLDT